MNNPYTETRDGNIILREFSESVDTDELVWHRDLDERVVIPTECDGWMFQKDNEAPVEMIPNKAFVIEKEVYHRIIRGSGRLKLKIIEGK